MEHSRALWLVPAKMTVSVCHVTAFFFILFSFLVFFLLKYINICNPEPVFQLVMVAMGYRCVRELARLGGHRRTAQWFTGWILNLAA